MSTLIFTDESGSWHDGDCYVRSWVKIDSIDYPQLEKEVLYGKHKTSVKELKYERFNGNQDKFKGIFAVRFVVFITVSLTEHFQSRDYRILRALQDIPPDTMTRRDALTNAIKQKVINSARNSLFFAYFERQHIENSKGCLLGDTNPDQFRYYVDAPQCQRKEWVAIAQECGIANVSVVEKSNEYPGIELADVIAGCISRKIQGDAMASRIYESFIKDKMSDMTSQSFPNPNLIFYGDFTDEQMRRFRGFR